MYRLVAVIATITLFACGGDTDTTEPRVTPLAPAVGLSISPSELSLLVDDEGRLTARAYDANDRTVDVSFAWSSADPSVASVDNGTVTGISAGNTTVTATFGTLRATASVAVRARPSVAVSISPSALTLIAGESIRLTASASDSAGRSTSASFEWSSADPAVAIVGKIDGIVTAIALGATTVTVAAGVLRATATVTVIPTAGALSGTFAFTRSTWSSAGTFSSDVLTFSGADRTLRSLPRPARFASIAAPAWSPDGSLLAVEVIHAFFGPPAFDWMEYNSDLYVLDAAAPTASPWRALTTNGLSTSPSWSPDGTRIAYLQQPALWSENNDIYVMDAAGGAPVRLTRTEAYHARPRWSPDGTRLAFDAYSPTVGNSEVFIVNADGSGLTNVTRSSARDVDPSWSPDGARLAFASNRDNTTGSFRLDLFVVDIDGSNVRRLASLAEHSFAPAWSPDGGQIIFSSGAALYVMNADGSSLTRLTAPPLNSWDSAPAWRR